MRGGDQVGRRHGASHPLPGTPIGESADGAWTDELVPAAEGRDFLFDTLSRLSLTDEGRPVSLGPGDLATLGLLRRTLEAPRTDLLLQLPRGKHDVAILCGFLAKLTLLVARHAKHEPTVPTGPVVIVGMNTFVHERLRRIRLADVPLAEGLVTCRMRHDGQLVTPTGATSDASAYPAALVYLNTRVGWPRLPHTVTPQAVVIDRTSFASPEIMNRALSWADEQGAATVVVVADIGDELTEQAMRARGRTFLAWPWSKPVLTELTWELGDAPVASALSMNVLCRSGFDPVQGAAFTAPAIDDGFRAVLRGLRDARRIDAPWPRPLQLVRRLTYGLAQLLATVEEFNQWAALDYRTTALSSIVHELEGRGYPGTFSGPWMAYGETRWPELRLDGLNLYRLINQENPKLYGLAYALERVAAEHPDIDIVVRVPNEPSGLAAQAVLSELLPEHAHRTRVRFVPWSERLPWADQELVEIHPGAPPPSRLPALWSAEGTYELCLAYPFELDLLNSALSRVSLRHRAALSDAARILTLGRPPSRPEPGVIDPAFTFDVDSRPSTTGRPAVTLDVDTEVLFEAIEGDVGEDEGGPPDVGLGEPATVDARPVILEPDGSWWWIREGREVEALVADKVTYLKPDELRAGMVVVVPRGEGREELFGRLVAAAHRRGDMQAFEVLFRRWRDACWEAHRRCRDWGEVETRMRAAGSTVTRQSPRTWAVGTVIAPDDPQDIERIGRISGDKLIAVQYRRLAAMADQVRALHARLGRLLSAAMAEALDLGGPSLDALTRLLGTDPSELLDEFELRAVRGVGAVEKIPSTDVRRLVAPR